MFLFLREDQTGKLLPGCPGDGGISLPYTALVLVLPKI
jgi:hypothetical protein